MSSGRILSLLCVVLLGFLSSCLSGSSGDATPQTPVAGLSFLHAAPASEGLNVLLDGRIINTGAFNYTSYSGYVGINPGTHTLRFNSSSDGSVKLDTSVSVVADKVYSLFLYNQGAKIKSLFTMDDSPGFATSNGMMVRAIHLSPDLGEVKVVLAGESKSVAASLKFTEASTFSEYNAKASTVELRSTVDNHVIVSQNFDATATQFFTIAILGYVNPPAGNANKLTVKAINN